MKINLTTKEYVLLSLPRRIKSKYFLSGQWIDTGTEFNWGNIYNRLLSCKTCDEADEIIGNHSWTRIDCDACNKEIERAIVIIFDDDEEPFTFCKDCIKGFLQSIEQAE